MCTLWRGNANCSLVLGWPASAGLLTAEGCRGQGSGGEEGPHHEGAASQVPADRTAAHHLWQGQSHLTHTPTPFASVVSNCSVDDMLSSRLLAALQAVCLQGAVLAPPRVSAVGKAVLADGHPASKSYPGCLHYSFYVLIVL